MCLWWFNSSLLFSVSFVSASGRTIVSSKLSSVTFIEKDLHLQLNVRVLVGRDVATVFA